MNSFIFPPNKIRHIQKVDNKWPNHWFVDDCFYGYLPHFIAVCHGTLDVEPAVCKLMLSVYSTVPVLTQPVASVWWLFPKLYWITHSPYFTLAKLKFFLPPLPFFFLLLFFLLPIFLFLSLPVLFHMARTFFSMSSMLWSVWEIWLHFEWSLIRGYVCWSDA